MGEYWRILDVDGREVYSMPFRGLKLIEFLWSREVGGMLDLLLVSPTTFVGWTEDVWPITEKDTPQRMPRAQSSKLLALSHELLREIFKCIDSLLDAIFLCIIDDALAAAGAFRVRQLLDREVSPWAGHRIICIGDYVDDPDSLPDSVAPLATQQMADADYHRGFYSFAKRTYTRRTAVFLAWGSAAEEATAEPGDCGSVEEEAKAEPGDCGSHDEDSDDEDSDDEDSDEEEATAQPGDCGSDNKEAMAQPGCWDNVLISLDEAAADARMSAGERRRFDAFLTHLDALAPRMWRRAVERTAVLCNVSKGQYVRGRALVRWNRRRGEEDEERGEPGLGHLLLGLICWSGDDDDDEPQLADVGYDIMHGPWAGDQIEVTTADRLRPDIEWEDYTKSALAILDDLYENTDY